MRAKVWVSWFSWAFRKEQVNAAASHGNGESTGLELMDKESKRVRKSIRSGDEPRPDSRNKEVDSAVGL
jgi:hypothetical protein